MGKYCHTPARPVGSENIDDLSFACDLCLQRLTRYGEMSTIAKKSASVLQACAKRLFDKSSNNVSRLLFPILPRLLTP
jgi:hypothetical protein